MSDLEGTRKRWGRIFQRGERWWVAYCAPVNGRAKELRESAGKTREEAERLLAKRRREVENHREGIRSFTGRREERLTVETLMDWVENDYTTRGLKSGRTASCHMAHVRRLLGSHRAASVNPAVVDRYVGTRRKEGASDTTIDRELEMLKRGFTIAHNSQAVPFKPPIPRLVATHANAREGFLTRPQFDAILERIEDADFRDFLEWFWWTGMRPGETGSLTWDGYDAENGSIHLAPRSAKTGRGRVIPIDGPLVEVIERRLARRTKSWRLIFHVGGDPIVKEKGGILDRLYDRWFSAVAGAREAMPDNWPEGTLIPYDLRRTAVRNLRAAGVPERVAMQISGHVTRTTFDRYGIVDETDLRTAFARVSAHTAGNVAKFRLRTNVRTGAAGKAGK